MQNVSQVRVSTNCNYCHKTLIARSTSDTGHLLRNIQSCKLIKLASNATSQSLLRFNLDGFVHH